MQANELDTQTFDAELAIPAELEDELLLVIKHPPLRGVTAPTATIGQAGLSLGLVPPPPPTQGRPGDSAAGSNDAGIADLFIELDPTELGLSGRHVLPAAAALPWI